MRCGQLDACVLGASQVSVHGDLAIGAKDVFVMMTLFAKDGSPKLVPQSTYPLTGVGCVSRVYTDLATIELGPAGAVITETFGIGEPDLRARLAL